MRSIGALAVLAAGVTLAGCGTSTAQPSSSQRESGEASAKGDACPADKPAPNPLPGVRQEHRSAGYWIARATDADAVILSPAAVRRHAAAFEAHDRAHPADDPLGQAALHEPLDRARLDRELGDRLAYLHKQVAARHYLDRAGKPVSPAAFAAATRPIEPSLRVALAPIALRCGPRLAGLYAAPALDRHFDRNNCSTIRLQEPVQVLSAGWPEGTMLVRTSYALGWIAADAPLSPVVPAEHAAAFASGERLRVARRVQLSDRGGAGAAVEPNTLLATVDGKRALFASRTGFGQSQPLESGEAASSARPLTRRALLEEAFRYLDSPYGWGGQGGGRDCSRFVMDVLASFGLRLPRHSGTQAKAGSMTIDLSKVTAGAERLALLDAAQARGVVLLHFPGHIMLYLGRDQRGVPMAIHAFAEYLTSCPASAASTARRETLSRVDRIQVSDLSLGAGTSRRSFLERITAITLLAETPGEALQGAVARRPPAPLAAPPKECSSTEEVAMFVSPVHPRAGEPLRIIVTAEHDLGSVELGTFDGEGRGRTPHPVKPVGGPPFGYWTEIAAPAPGTHTAVIGDGEQVAACLRFTVHDKPAMRMAGGGAVWQPRRRWTAATENLYATFVEQLFDYSDEDRTWSNLQGLLSDKEHNILYDHLGQGEDARLRLKPDCADLPYFLRAYFSWKLRLPFGFRKCNRGHKGKAPYCDGHISSNLTDRDASGEVDAFAEFARRDVADTVHSGSGRTGPEDERTDYYPVPLTRAALKPGTLFADPYGHVLIVADWKPQGAGSYGVLVGADAQPDGTIGRRRFWRGSFLFTPDTAEAGAGFKRFRPVVYRGGRVRPLGNEQIAGRPGMVPFSLAQYGHGKDGFYDRVEELINPRPLEPGAVLEVLVQALYEQVKRRVISVQNAEDYKKSHRGRIAMPRGHAIFETTGPWEDYSTPSRDMRLLIAMDTVTGFPERVRQSPGRYGVAPDAAAQVVASLQKQLAARLAALAVEYKKSDGSPHKLLLADVVARIQGFEVAYNPNDCVEKRWAAPDGSAEVRSCSHQAPSPQLQRMGEYRPWFAKRARPAR